MKPQYNFARRNLLRAAIGLAATVATPVCADPARYPEHPVHLVVPYPPGGSVDFVARVLQPPLQEALGQPVIVDNRGGASGMIGSSAVAKAKPDGYTLLLGSVQTHAMNVAVIKNMLYDAMKDFTPIIETTRANWILAANPGIGIRTPADLVAAARAKPDTLTYASSGNGSAAHLAFSMLASDLGIRITHVPYRGIAQGITDAISGQVSLVMGDQSTLLQHIKAGTLVAVAMTGNIRSPLLPQTPTIAETLIPGFDVQAWQAIWGPPDMDPALARKINEAFTIALRNPSAVERLTVSGVDVAGGSVDQFTTYTRSELDRWVGAARKANINPE